MATNWDLSNPPLAYLLTFRTFGTWHHGDSRGSVDRRFFHEYRSPFMPASEGLVAKESSTQKGNAFTLDSEERKIVEIAIREVCSIRGYDLKSLNVRSNHTHVVTSHNSAPEKIVEAFKSYSTRALRSRNQVYRNQKIWARHCSNRYLWNHKAVFAAVDYVEHFQEYDFPSFDEVLDELV